MASPFELSTFGVQYLFSPLQECYLKGMEFANVGKWVHINLNDEGYFAFKGVKDKRKVLSVKVANHNFASFESQQGRSLERSREIKK